LTDEAVRGGLLRRGFHLEVELGLLSNVLAAVIAAIGLYQGRRRGRRLGRRRIVSIVAALRDTLQA
jgi:hypothetical protein